MKGARSHEELIVWRLSYELKLAVRVSQIARELTRQVPAKAFRYQTWGGAGCVP